MQRSPVGNHNVVGWIMLGCVAILAGVSGCSTQNEFDIAEASTRSKEDAGQEASADFRTAITYLEDLHEFEITAATAKICYHLHRWATTKEPDPDWIADPLYSRLPKRLDRMKAALTPLTEKATFSAFDVMMLREAIWMRDLSRQMKDAEVQDAAFADWIESGSVGDLDESAKEDLRVGFAICDWVVRNVQLDLLHSEVGYATETEDSSEESSDETPKYRDGADSLPWEALLLGHGDWIARGRIATLMGRQLGINIVMLGIEGDGEDRPWCLGIQLRDQVYLFDMRLGLPIPAEDGKGIATLQNVVDSPELIRSLDEYEAEAYPVSNDDLKNVVALIDAPPEYLTQRMKIVEASLSNKGKMVLTCAPSSIKQELNKCKGIVNVRLWTLPFDAYWQRMQMQSSSTTAEYMVALMNDLKMIDGNLGHPLAAGRRQHFRGNFTSTDEVVGAKEFYLHSRMPEASIKDIEQLTEKGKSELRKYKRFASYWLGLIAFNESEYEMATNYFDKRLLSVKDQGDVWTQGASYNLARTLEQLAAEASEEDAAEFRSRARELYLGDTESPQFAGNRLRASRLEQK